MDASTSVPQPVPLTSDKIDGEAAAGTPFPHPLAPAAEILLAAAADLSSALIRCGVADYLNYEATGLYEAGSAAIQSPNPYTRRVGLLNLLQALVDQPEAVSAAIDELHEALAKVQLLPVPTPAAVPPTVAWPEFAATANALLDDKDRSAPTRLDTVVVSPRVAGEAGALSRPPVTLWIEAELYVGASRDRLHRALSISHDHEQRVWLRTIDDELWLLAASEIAPRPAA